MKVKAVILVFLILFSAVLPIQAAIDEGYGEDETSLGQFVDSFENLDNVSVAVNVVRNSTLNAMELNFTIGARVIEDFTRYTEVDADGDLTITSPRITVSSMRRDADSHVYFDYGAAFFGDFEFNFELNISNVEAGDGPSWSVTGISFLANEINSINDITIANGQYLGMIFSQFAANDDRFFIYVWQFDAGNVVLGRLQDGGGDYVFDLMNFEYYFTFNRSGQNLGGYAYNDSAKNNLIASRELVGDATTYRYAYGICNYNAAGGGGDHWSGYFENWCLGIVADVYDASGYFTTVDYLSDPLANGSALVSMTISDIPANTAISLEFSEDNSTWGDASGATGSESLSGGFESFDLRDLNYSLSVYKRFNLSTTDSTITPRLNQSRLITTLGAVGAGVPGQNLTGIWIEYRATAINASVGIVDAGDLNSTFEIDGDTFNVSEVVGAPGMLLSVNFTGIDPDAECVWVSIWYLYDGNLNHVFEIEMWNFTSSTWVTDGLLVDTAVFVWANSTIYALRIPNEFLSGGELRVQLNHETPGNINHDLFIDYIRLIAKVPSDVEAEVFQFFWIVIAIALMIVGIVLARMWPDEGDP